MSSAPSPLSYVYDGRECLGFILARGKLGFEAVDRDERSLGRSKHSAKRQPQSYGSNHRPPRHDF
jgi:hypothetical protein